MNWDDLLCQSYTPYSQKPDACLVQARSGLCYRGVRIENASFPLTISAVQAAICNCLSMGEVPDRVIMPPGKSISSYWINEYKLEITETDNLQNYRVKSVIHTDIDRGHVISLLKKILPLAITPNSGFAVAVFIKSRDRWIYGVNIETSDWSHGLCAERVALSKALSEGITSIEELYLYTPAGNFCSPCGACLQVLCEHIREAHVVLYHPDQTNSTHFLSHFLPYNFTLSPEQLHQK